MNAALAKLLDAFPKANLLTLLNVYGSVKDLRLSEVTSDHARDLLRGLGVQPGPDAPDTVRGAFQSFMSGESNFSTVGDMLANEDAVTYLIGKFTGKSKDDLVEVLPVDRRTLAILTGVRKGNP